MLKVDGQFPILVQLKSGRLEGGRAEGPFGIVAEAVGFLRDAQKIGIDLSVAIEVEEKLYGIGARRELKSKAGLTRWHGIALPKHQPWAWPRAPRVLRFIALGAVENTDMKALGCTQSKLRDGAQREELL